MWPRAQAPDPQADGKEGEDVGAGSTLAQGGAGRGAAGSRGPSFRGVRGVSWVWGAGGVLWTDGWTDVFERHWAARQAPSADCDGPGVGGGGRHSSHLDVNLNA